METKKTTMKVKGKNGWEIIHPETEVDQVVGLYETVTSAVETATNETDIKLQALKSQPINDWGSGTAYKLKDICVYEDIIYQCIEANSDTDFDKDKWTAIGGGGGLGVWELAGDNAIIPKDLTALTPEEVGTDEATIRSIVESMIPHLPIGMYIKLSHNGAVPEGCLECNGASVANAMYPDLNALWDGKYGRPDPDHFYLPDLRGKFLMGADEAGIAKEAGLPNIEGTIGVQDYNYATAYFRSTSGSFKLGSISTTYANSGQGSEINVNSKDAIFDASLSNSIYGSSDTVQPPAITCRVCVVAFHTTNGSLGLLDTTQIVNEINRKQDRLKDNVDYVVERYHDLEGNWYCKYKSGWVEQGGITTVSTVTLLKPYTDNNYNVMLTERHKSYFTQPAYSDITATGFNVIKGEWPDRPTTWMAYGQGAEV